MAADLATVNCVVEGVGVDVDAEAGVDADAETGVDVDVETGVDADAETGADADAETGVDADAETGVDADAETGVDADVDGEGRGKASFWIAAGGEGEGADFGTDFAAIFVGDAAETAIEADAAAGLDAAAGTIDLGFADAETVAFSSDGRFDGGSSLGVKARISTNPVPFFAMPSLAAAA